MEMADKASARKAKRVDVSIPAWIVRSSGDRQSIELRDLSFYGLRARTEVLPPRGDYVKLDLPGIGIVRAKVSWAKDGFFGAAFATAVDVRKCVAAFESIAAAQQ